MHFLILGLNYAPERIGIAVYTSGMAEALVAAGHEVDVIAGYPYYPAWKVMDQAQGKWARSEVENGVTIQRVAHYVPKVPSGAKRLLHHASFALNALIPTVRRARAKRPDMVIAIAPSLIAAPVAKLAAKVSGAKSWLHIQDFEVEAAFATDLIDARSSVGRLALGFEKYVLGLFDTVSAISPQMCAKLKEKGVPADRIVQFRNWANIEKVVPSVAPSPYRAEWNITTPHVALYSGNIGKKQGIEIVVEAAKSLADRDDITFVICGEGPNRADLMTLARGLTHVQFHDLQPMEQLNDLMGLATIHLLPQLARVADLVLPSKLTNMLASGRPIVAAAAEGTGLWEEVGGCGVTVPPGNSAAFASAIVALANDATLARNTGAEARRRAEQRWSKSRIMDGFLRNVLARSAHVGAEGQTDEVQS